MIPGVNNQDPLIHQDPFDLDRVQMSGKTPYLL
jgi:hypothetical protein